MQTLFDALRSGKHPHAILLACNDEGRALETARECAAIYLCQGEGGVVKPCHECKGCAMFFSGNHPDFITVDAVEGKSSIGIDQARALLGGLYSSPQFSGRAIIFKQAHRLTEQAQNALLKTLEEPPPDTLFLLTGNPEGLLVTVRSRVMSVRLPNEPDAKLDDQARLSVEQMCQGQIHIQAKYYSGYEKKRKQAEQLLELQAGWFLRVALGSPRQGNFVKCSMALLDAKKKLARNANYNLVIDVLLIEIASALKA